MSRLPQTPPNDDGEPSGDGDEWIKAADASYLPTNLPKTIEFRVPDAAREGMGYFVAVRTRYNRSGKERKKAVTGISSRLIAVSCRLFPFSII